MKIFNILLMLKECSALYSKTNDSGLYYLNPGKGYSVCGSRLAACGLRLTACDWCLTAAGRRFSEILFILIGYSISHHTPHTACRTLQTMTHNKNDN